MSRLALVPLLLAFALPVVAADPPKPTAAEEKLLAKLKDLKGEATLDPELMAGHIRGGPRCKKYQRTLEVGGVSLSHEISGEIELG